MYIINSILHYRTMYTMKTISVSEFRKNIKKYADLAHTERIIVSRGSGEAFAVVPINTLEDKGYNPKFVKKVLKANEAAKKGAVTIIKDSNNIWEDIL